MLPGLVSIPEALVAWASRFEKGWRTGFERRAGPPDNLSLYYAWAGAVMERDLAKKRGPGALARMHGR